MELSGWNINTKLNIKGKNFPFTIFCTSTIFYLPIYIQFPLLFFPLRISLFLFEIIFLSLKTFSNIPCSVGDEFSQLFFLWKNLYFALIFKRYLLVYKILSCFFSLSVLRMFHCIVSGNKSALIIFLSFCVHNVFIKLVLWVFFSLSLVFQQFDYYMPWFCYL